MDLRIRAGLQSRFTAPLAATVADWLLGFSLLIVKIDLRGSASSLKPSVWKRPASINAAEGGGPKNSADNDR
jgi:hypothetical protein